MPISSNAASRLDHRVRGHAETIGERLARDLAAFVHQIFGLAACPGGEWAGSCLQPANATEPKGEQLTAQEINS